MNSHEYANKLKVVADALLSKPEFETPSKPTIRLYFWSNKTEFLGAVKALGAGNKEYTTHDLDFTPVCAEGLSLTVSRSAVCRKVQEEKWECEPLLSEMEEAQVGV